MCLKSEVWEQTLMPPFMDKYKFRTLSIGAVTLGLGFDSNRMVLK